MLYHFWGAEGIDRAQTAPRRAVQHSPLGEHLALPCNEVDQEIIGINLETPSASFVLGSNDIIQTFAFEEAERYQRNTLNNLNSSEQWHHYNTCLLAKCI